MIATDDEILSAASNIRESSVAWADDPKLFSHLIELTPGEVRKLIAALTGTQQAKGEVWRSDMENAPRDGSEVDLWAFWPERAEYRRTPDAVWASDVGEWMLGQYSESQFVHRPQVTHWMPRPAAPVAALIAGRG